MAQIEIDIKVEFHLDGEYIPAVRHKLPEDCHESVYPNVEIDKVMDDITGEEIKVTNEDEQKIIEHIEKNELEHETSFLFTFDCEVEIDRTIKYNGQDMTEFIEEDYINELFS